MLWKASRRVLLALGGVFLAAQVLLWFTFHTSDCRHTIINGCQSTNVQGTILAQKGKVTVSRNKLPCYTKFQNGSSQTLQVLLAQFNSSTKWSWIRSRVQDNWSLWQRAVTDLEKRRLVPKSRHSQNILVCPGVLFVTDFADDKRISTGGPLGDLVQWADVISALHVLGHNVALDYDVYAVYRGLRYGFGWEQKGRSRCAHDTEDLIFLDLMAIKQFPRFPDSQPAHRSTNGLHPTLTENSKCKYRVLDAYGTHAMYNHPDYAHTHNYTSIYGGNGLHLKQFYTFYPHTPDNSFLGFTVRHADHRVYKKDNIALLYGKDLAYFKGKSDYIQALTKFLEVHATLPNTSGLPPEVVNHGVLPQHEYSKLLAKTKVLVGVGRPLESTAVVEALSYGCVFLNPRFTASSTSVLQVENKPTSRKMSSQVPYLEKFDRAHVMTLDIGNMVQVRSAARQLSRRSKFPPLVLNEFSMHGFLLRLYTYVSGQNFCQQQAEPVWPSLEHMRVVKGKPKLSCSDVCEKADMLCEPFYFDKMNTVDAFNVLGLVCGKKIKVSSFLAPAYATNSSSCMLQADKLLYSCAGSQPRLQRICPCRAHLPEDGFSLHL